MVFYDKAIKRLFSLKASTLRKLRKVPHKMPSNPVLRNHYKAIHSRIHLEIFSFKLKHESKVIYDVDVRKFFKHTNSILHTTNHTSSLKAALGQLTNDPATLATMFNSTFASAYSTDNEITPSVIQPYPILNQLGTISFPTDSIRYHLNRLKNLAPLVQMAFLPTHFVPLATV